LLGIVERRAGSLDVKSAPVHFYVQRKSTFTYSSNRNIPFDLELLNEGRAMNLATGVFRAPVNGVYYFSFRGFPQGGDLKAFHPVLVYLRVNGMVKATSTSVVRGVTISLECTLKLKKGDNVDIRKGFNGVFEDNNSEHLTHFSGSLLEEDLEIF